MELNYRSFGEGYPVIILHGLFGSLDNWQTFAKKLAVNFQVYILDQRNHGRSPHAQDFNYEVLAEDLQLFMQDRWIYEAHIIGHSLGGKTAMQFALQYPDYVNRLLILDIAPRAYSAGHQAIFDALLSVDTSRIGSRKLIDDYLKEKIKEHGVRQFLLKNLKRTKAGEFEWKMNLPVLYRNYPQILEALESEEAFEKPVLFVRGGRSNYIKNEDLSLIKTFFPQAELASIESAGHWIHADAPEELLKLVNAFLNPVEFE